MRKVFVFVVIAAVFVLAIVQDHLSTNSKKLHVQGIDSVVSAQFVPANGGAGATAITLNATNAKDRKVLSKVLDWLNTSRIVGDAKDQFFPIGGNPTSFTIGFTSGGNIRIVDALGAISRKLDNGSIEVHSGSIPNQVTIYQNNKAQRIVALELKEWIVNGWQQEEPFTFTPEQAVSKVLKEHLEFPATGEKQVFEDIGGKQGHKQPVTLTTKVEKRGVLEYLVTLKKDYNLVMGGKEAVQYWVYSVDRSNVTLIDQQGNVPDIK